MVVFVASYRIGKSKHSFKLDSKNKKQALISACRIVWRKHSVSRYGDYVVTKQGKLKAKDYCKNLTVKKRGK